MLTRKYILTLLYSALFVGMASAFHIYLHGTDEEAVRLLIRWTAKTAAVFFAGAFVASSVHYILKNKFSASWLALRPQLGLIFTVFHSYHLLFLIFLQLMIHPVFSLAKSISLLGGGMAYVFMYSMAITTFPIVKNRMTPQRWKMLHTIGGYWIWFIFIRSYFKNVINKEQYYVLFALFVLVLLLRLIQVIQTRRRTTS